MNTCGHRDEDLSIPIVSGPRRERDQTVPLKYQKDEPTFKVSNVLRNFLASGWHGYMQPVNRGLCRECAPFFTFNTRAIRYDGGIETPHWCMYDQTKISREPWSISAPVSKHYNYPLSTENVLNEISNYQRGNNLAWVTVHQYLHSTPKKDFNTSIDIVISPTFISGICSVTIPRPLEDKRSWWDRFCGRGSTNWTTDTASSGYYVCLSREVDPEIVNEVPINRGASLMKLPQLLSHIKKWTQGKMLESLESEKARREIRAIHDYPELPAEMYDFS